MRVRKRIVAALGLDEAGLPYGPLAIEGFRKVAREVFARAMGGPPLALDMLDADYESARVKAELTNLGVLLLGTAADRARLGTAPVVQAIKYDERGTKIGKYVWDDYTLRP